MERENRDPLDGVPLPPFPLPWPRLTERVASRGVHRIAGNELLLVEPTEGEGVGVQLPEVTAESLGQVCAVAKLSPEGEVHVWGTWGTVNGETTVFLSAVGLYLLVATSRGWVATGGRS